MNQSAVVQFKSGGEVKAPPEYRMGYFGTGNRVHLYTGSAEGDGRWTPICMLGFWGFRNERMEEIAEEDVKVDCWRCAKKMGVIDKYPGPEVRRRLDRGLPLEERSR